MGDQDMEDPNGDVNMSNTEMVFDNLTILKEYSNITNSVSADDFLELVPKAKLSTSKRVKWVPLFNCLKQGLLDEIVQEMNEMWKMENMPQRLEILEKQKEKFGEMNTDQTLWRPQLGDVKAQLKACDVANYKKQKDLLESLAKEYANRVDRKKKSLSAKRGYLKALQMDVQKYQKKNEDCISLISEKIKSQKRLVQNIPSFPSEKDIEEFKWKITDD